MVPIKQTSIKCEKKLNLFSSKLGKRRQMKQFQRS